MMTIDAITNGIVLAGVVVVFAVITGGALVARQPAGWLTGTAMWFESLSGWRLVGVAVIGWLALAALTISLWIPIPIPLSRTGSTIARVAGLILFLAGVVLILWGRHDGQGGPAACRASADPPWSVRDRPAPDVSRILAARVGTLVTYRTWVLAGYLAVIVPRFLGRARMEERALAAAFGQDWTDYASHVPMWISWFPRRGGANAARRRADD